MPKDEFDDLQRFVLDNYSNGEFSYITTKKELKQLSDGLLSFLVTEISRKEDCENDDNAIQRLEMVSAQINDLATCFACRGSNIEKEEAVHV